MKRIKSVFASAVVGLVVLAGFGFGIMALGFAIVLGGGFALALSLAGPRRPDAGPNEAGGSATDTPRDPATAETAPV